MSLLPADSQIKSELRSVILRKASLIEKASKGKSQIKKTNIHLWKDIIV